MRRIASALAALCTVLVFDVALADDIAVPADLQASLLAKVVSYDRNLAERAGDRVHTLLVGKPKDPTSMPFIRQMRQALGEIATFGSFPHDDTHLMVLRLSRDESVQLLVVPPEQKGGQAAMERAADPSNDDTAAEVLAAGGAKAGGAA